MILNADSCTKHVLALIAYTISEDGYIDGENDRFTIDEELGELEISNANFKEIVLDEDWIDVVNNGGLK